MITAPPFWKASVPSTKSEAQDIVAAFELGTSPQAVLINEEPFADRAVVEALYIDMPDGDLLTKLAGRAVHVALLPDINWIKLSQEGLPPVRAGRFFVYGAHDAGVVPHGVIPIRIEAGLAFGTGHHETTALCLRVLSDLSKKRRFANVLDLGCGTGLLAIGAAKLWRKQVLASDIDVVAVEVTRENAVANGEAPLVRALTADGLTHPVLAKQAPYDLIIANILASPLTKLAPEIAKALAPGGIAVLSGLLQWQENMVVSCYRPHGLILRGTRRDGVWSALTLEKPTLPLREGRKIRA
jgi:ribosomal protein L11 methyltransferase